MFSLLPLHRILPVFCDVFVHGFSLFSSCWHRGRTVCWSFIYECLSTRLLDHPVSLFPTVAQAFRSCCDLQEAITLMKIKVISIGSKQHLLRPGGMPACRVRRRHKVAELATSRTGHSGPLLPIYGQHRLLWPASREETRRRALSWPLTTCSLQDYDSQT
jgi:hypothetical protein